MKYLWRVSIYLTICTIALSLMTDIESVVGGDKVSIERVVGLQPLMKGKAFSFINHPNMGAFVAEFISLPASDSETIDKHFYALQRKYRIAPTKVEIRTTFEKNYGDVSISPLLRRWMIKCAGRSQSGVLVVTVTLSPHRFSCKYDCAYCPQETDISGNPTQPRSYLSTEPAMLRALQHNFDIKGQFWDRISSYVHTGNIGSGSDFSKKMEIILSGGTWESYPLDYREQVMNHLYWAANTFRQPRPCLTLEEEIRINETTEFRIIGLTIETRPDNVTAQSVQDYRRWGVTRVQIGVQHYDDDILYRIKRRCCTADTVRAIGLLKSTGFKVVVHLMPDLPTSSAELDKWMFDQAIDRQELQFDDVKIYPTAVCKSSTEGRIVKSAIADWYSEGTYIPYGERDLNELIDAIIHYKRRVNPWVRIQRVVRDIPGSDIEAGYHKVSNLRQRIEAKMKANGEKCHCIRCMEIKGTECKKLQNYLVARPFIASNEQEYFLSVESHNMKVFEKFMYLLHCILSVIVYFLTLGRVLLRWHGNLNSYQKLIGFLRLRLDRHSGAGVIPELRGCALIREVHVYGLSLGVGDDGNGAQHKGYGKLLMKTAENISRRSGFKKIAVIAGVGSREYYRLYHGYQLIGTYMIKDL